MVAKRKTRANRVLVLFSGGLDSTACAVYYQSMKYEVTTLFVDYGQAARDEEQRASRKVAAKLGVKRIRVRIDPMRTGVGLIPGRNAMLLSIGLMRAPFDQGLIAIGVHAGTNYPDCSEDFIRQMNVVTDFYAAGSIRIDAPFAKWSKADIFEFLKMKRGPIASTYSCERGGAEGCGKCLSCKDRIALHVR
jgi:7-cyano-7-deazaguanine synthase